MIIKKSILVSVLSICIFSLPIPGWADQCDDMTKEAYKVFDEADAATKQKKYDEAIELYKKALGLFTTVSKMTDCSNIAIPPSAGKNIPICEGNIEKVREAKEEQAKYEKELEAYEKFNEAKAKFDEGTKLIKQSEYEKAIILFEEAQKLWESIANNETKNGQTAMKFSERARKSARKAREWMEN